MMETKDYIVIGISLAVLFGIGNVIPILFSLKFKVDTLWKAYEKANDREATLIAQIQDIRTFQLDRAVTEAKNLRHILEQNDTP